MPCPAPPEGGEARQLGGLERRRQPLAGSGWWEPWISRCAGDLSPQPFGHTIGASEPMLPGHSSAKSAILSPSTSCLASWFSVQALEPRRFMDVGGGQPPSPISTSDSVLLKAMPSLTPLSPGIADAGLIHPSRAERKQSIRCHRPGQGVDPCLLPCISLL